MRAATPLIGFGHIGVVNAIAIDPATGDRLGAADPRHDGAAVGY